MSEPWVTVASDQAINTSLSTICFVCRLQQETIDTNIKVVVDALRFVTVEL